MFHFTHWFFHFDDWLNSSIDFQMYWLKYRIARNFNRFVIRWLNQIFKPFRKIPNFILVPMHPMVFKIDMAWKLYSFFNELALIGLFFSLTRNLNRLIIHGPNQMVGRFRKFLNFILVLLHIIVFSFDYWLSNFIHF